MRLTWVAALKHPTVIWHPVQRTPRISANRESLGYISAAMVQACLFQICVVGSKKAPVLCVMAVQGHPRSLISAINSNFGLFCIISETRQLKKTKNCNLEQPPHLTPPLGVNPFKFLDEPQFPKNRVSRISVSEELIILAWVVLIQYQHDRQTTCQP